MAETVHVTVTIEPNEPAPAPSAGRLNTAEIVRLLALDLQNWQLRQARMR